MIRTVDVDGGVAAVTARTMPLGMARLAVAAFSALLVAYTLNPWLGAGWYVATLCAEALTWFATKPQRQGQAPSERQLRIYLLTIIFMNLVWCSLSVALWQAPSTAFHLAAVIMLSAQLLHAQVFTAHSPVMMIVVGGAPTLTLLGLLVLVGPYTATERLLMVGAAAIMLLYSFGAAWTNHKRELKLAEARDAADEAHRQKSLYLSIVSHELRTPLNGILGMAQALDAPTVDRETRERARTLTDAAKSMRCILNDTLDIARLEAGAAPVASESLQPRELARQLSDFWQPSFSAKGLTCTVGVNEHMPVSILGDRQRLVQVCNNLLGNALKYTASGGVEVTIGPSAFGWTIEVLDSGPGMTADEVQTLFTPFARFGGAREHHSEGSGLGLYLSRMLAVSMGGRLSVESARETGTRAALDLPLVVSSSVVQHHHAPVDETLAGFSVLVIEDHPANAMVARTLLEALGCRVTTAVDGKSGLELARDTAFDAVLIDLRLPDMDGASLPHALKALPTMRHTRLIAFTAEVSADTLAALPSKGFHRTVQKPVMVAELYAALTAKS